MYQHSAKTEDSKMVNLCGLTSNLNLIQNVSVRSVKFVQAKSLKQPKQTYTSKLAGLSTDLYPNFCRKNKI